MPYTMEFDQKQLPPELLYKLEEAKTDEARNLEPTDATNPFPSAPQPEYSPVKGVVEEMMSHWAVDADVNLERNPEALNQSLEKGKANKDLDDKLSIKSGIAADFVPDSAGPATDVGMPEAKKAGNEFGGEGGGDGGGDIGDDWMDVDMWRRKRRSPDGDEAPVEEEPIVEEPETESESTKE